jgi:hypothetical protein
MVTLIGNAVGIFFGGARTDKTNIDAANGTGCGRLRPTTISDRATFLLRRLALPSPSEGTAQGIEFCMSYE